jgi:hypothetical protein
MSSKSGTQLRPSSALKRKASDGARKRSVLITEQLALHESGRDRCTIQGDERTVAARARLVNGARNRFLAGARFPFDENRGVGGRHHVDQL